MLLKSTRAALATLAVSSVIFASAQAQSPQPTPPSSSKQAVENRKAAFTLVGNYFRYFGAVTKGTIAYDEAEAAKRAARIAFLSSIVEDAFPEGSNAPEPESKAKAEVWSNRADFDKKLRDFQAHAKALVDVNANEKSASESFKAAVAALAQDCKSCHETYKAK